MKEFQESARFQNALAAIDAVNAEDPVIETVGQRDVPRAVLYFTGDALDDDDDFEEEEEEEESEGSDDDDDYDEDADEDYSPAQARLLF